VPSASTTSWSRLRPLGFPSMSDVKLYSPTVWFLLPLHECNQETKARNKIFSGEVVYKPHEMDFGNQSAGYGL
jgi:predicted kinase